VRPDGQCARRCVVYPGFGDDAPAQRRRIARSFAAYAAKFLVVLGAGSVANLGVWLSILADVVIGILVAIGAHVREPRSKPKQPEMQV
jgi:hypothetical protein